MEPTDRRSDWADGIEKNIVNLNTAISDLQRNLREARRLGTTLDHVVNGNPETHDPGFDARIEKIEDSLRRINGTLWADPAGSRGLVAEFRDLQQGRQDKKDLRGDIIKVIAIIASIITSASVAIYWRDIQAHFFKKSTDPVDQMIEQTRHPKSRHRHVTIRQIPADEPDPEN